MLWDYITFEAQQHDTIDFPRKNTWNYKNIFLILCVTVAQRSAYTNWSISFK